MSKILSYTLPIWISMLINSLLGLTDFVFLSTIALQYITVVGFAYIPYNFLTSIFVGLGIEANRIHAKGYNIHIKKLFFYSIIFSSIICIIIFYFSKYVLFLYWENNLYQEIQSYFNVLIFSIIPATVIFICTGIMRGKGSPKNTIYFSILCVILNLIFDVMFIKINLINNPLIGCAIATILADLIVAIIYVIYISNNYKNLNNQHSLKKFFINSFTNSIEKIFSVSTLQIISSFFLIKIDVVYSNIYFALDRFLQPIQLYAHSFFEWIIFANSKKIKPTYSIYILYFILVIFLTILSSIYLKVDKTGAIYALILSIYIFLFFINRGIIAGFFSCEKGKLVNIVSLMKNIFFIIALMILVYKKQFNLISFGITNLSFLSLEILILLTIKNISKKDDIDT